MSNLFRSADIMLPEACEYDKWAVIACDQHTSEPEYWQSVRNYIGDTPSTLDMFFPEADLSDITTATLEKFSENMRRYIDQDFFHEFRDAYIYVERTLLNGEKRQGVVGVIDLEYYDYDPKPNTKVYATEATVLQRVPPRIALRKIADLEFSHTVMFCDDKNKTIIEPIRSKLDQLKIVYDFDLMTNGGHITGYLLSKDIALNFESAVKIYEENNAYLVGDGNHSLVTAKLTYEALKELNPNADWENHPARYAMVELENIHSEAMVFEPIYRVAKTVEADSMIRALMKLDAPGGAEISWFFGKEKGIVHLEIKDHELPIEALQRFLDNWFESHDGSVDYIHGKDTVKKLAQQPDTVGFILPDMSKSILFPYILTGKVMPKKTFSIGHAEEKRYYLEGRKIR